MVPMMRNSVLEGLSASMFADIQCEMAWKVELSVELAEWKSVGSTAMKSCVSSAYRWWLILWDLMRWLSGVVSLCDWPKMEWNPFSASGRCLHA